MKALLAGLLLASAWLPLAAKPASFDLPVFAPSTAPVTLNSLLERFENFDKKINSLSADFEETIRMGEGTPMQTILGSIEYLKPSLLRIEHTQPERQTVVCDGKALWVWRRDTNQVIESDLADWKKSQPESFLLVGLSSSKELLKLYELGLADISAPGPDGHRRVTLELKPKENHADFSLRLTLTTKDFFPARIELKTGELLLTSVLSRVRLNPDLPEENFRFSPPEGSEVFSNFRPPALP